MIDTSRHVDTSLVDELQPPGKSSEGCGFGFRCGVSRKGAFSKDLFGEVEDTRITESSSRIRIPGYGNEVQTGTEVEFTEEVCGRINQEIYRAMLSEYENSGFRKKTSEEEINERRFESCGADEHHAMENDYVLSPESGELNDEQSDDDYFFEDISDTDFLNVDEFDVNEARSDTSFAASLNSVACDNVTAIASNFGGCVKASRSVMWGARALIELKTGGVDQKLCNATNVADETQMCTAEYTVDTFGQLDEFRRN